MLRQTRWALVIFVLLCAQSMNEAMARPFNISMILFRGCEDACKGFKEYFVTNKIPVNIEFLDAESDAKKIPALVSQVKAKRPDLVVTWGTTVSIAVLGQIGKVDPNKHITDIPALFMIASTPVGSKLVPNLNSSERNISGTLYIVPPDTLLNAARLYMPFKRLGYILNSTENNSKVLEAEINLLKNKFGYEFIKVDVPLNAEGKPMKESLPGLIEQLAEKKVDLLYMAADSFLLVNRDVITQTAMSLNLPVLASAEAAVIESNALLGVVNRYFTVGQLTASQAEKILVVKVNPKDIPIVAPPQFSYLVNMRVAKELKRYPPIKVLQVADVIK
jgi:putative ABC transport system substrate-binding protein